MIDTKLIAKAKPKSELIETIDSSWRDFVDNLKNNVFKFRSKAHTKLLLKKTPCLLRVFADYSG